MIVHVKMENRKSAKEEPFLRPFLVDIDDKNRGMLIRKE
jgi:hypothetical protein